MFNLASSLTATLARGSATSKCGYGRIFRIDLYNLNNTTWSAADSVRDIRLDLISQPDGVSTMNKLLIVATAAMLASAGTGFAQDAGASGGGAAINTGGAAGAGGGGAGLGGAGAAGLGGLGAGSVGLGIFGVAALTSAVAVGGNNDSNTSSTATATSTQ
jgi:hypothetical protein